MSTAEIRQRLHDYIDIAEDKKLEAIYTLLQDNSIADDYELTDEQKTELDKRLHDYQNGIGRTYNWDETVAIIDKELIKRRK